MRFAQKIFLKFYTEIMHVCAEFSLGYKNASSQCGVATLLFPSLPNPPLYVLVQSELVTVLSLLNFNAVAKTTLQQPLFMAHYA